MLSQRTSPRALNLRPIVSVALVFLFVGGFSGAVAFSARTGGSALTLGLHPSLAANVIRPFATETCSTSGLCPSQVQGAYQFASLLANASMNGTGQSIVIIDACGDSAMASDAAQFDLTNHLPAINLTIYTPQGTPCSDPTGWGVETALDVEWAHAMAPGAAIHLVEAKSASNANLYGAWNYSLTNHLGLVFSNSWGGSGACTATISKLLTTATKAGVTVLASAGDSGAWGSGKRLAVQQPADCTVVTAVGGTTLNVGTGGTYSSESAWSGSGGGYVTKVTEPTYQKTANISDSLKLLGKPDVSAVANPSTGVWVYDAAAGGWFVVGGTSVACPIWAAFLADVNSWRASNGFGGLGSLNPFLYGSIYGVNGGLANYTATFHDVTTGSNGWSAGTGWDAATGIGSFRAYPLANLLANNPKA